MGKRLVIIGCGRIAHKHAEQARNMEISLLLIGEKGTKKIGGEYIYVLEYVKTIVQLVLGLGNLPNYLPGVAEGLAAVNLIAAIYALPQEPVIRQNHG